MDFDRLFDDYQDTLEDFWNRRTSGPRHEAERALLGRPLRVLSNHPGPARATELSLPRFSTAPSVRGRTFVVQVVARPAGFELAEPPDDLMGLIRYTGHGRWVSLDLNQWGCAFVDLARRRACAVIAEELASRPAIFSRCVLDTILLNLLIGDGHGMLHATALARDGRAVLLMAGHNVGKSTTALRLALAGFKLVSDSQVLVPPDGPTTLMGFPVGLVRLRPDTAPLFSDVTTATPSRIVVRGESKLVLDLAGEAPHLVERRAVSPERIDIFLLERHAAPGSTVTAASRQQLEAAVMRNSLFWDERRAWRRNLRSIQPVLDAAHVRHLVIGSDLDAIVESVEAAG